MNLRKNYKLSSIILAAGKSGRIGEPKAFLELNGRTFISIIVSKILRFSDRIVVVFGFDGERNKLKLLNEDILKNHPKKILIEINSDYELGMFSSIKCGLQKISDQDFVLIHQIDQPSLPDEFYESFIQQIDESTEWLQPFFDGIPGHPIIINQKIMKIILSENSSSNLRDLKRKYSIKMRKWNCNFPEIHQDIDTKMDYEILLIGKDYEYLRKNF